MTSDPKVYTPADIARVLHCTTRTVLNYLSAGELPGRKIGGRWKVLEEDLKDFIRRDPITAPSGKGDE